MNKLLVTAFALCALFGSSLSIAETKAAPPAAAPAAAGHDCEAMAVDKNGKPLHGAAKTAKMKKCMADGGSAAKGAAPAAPPAANAGCEAKAIDKNGKPLHGAAKGASIKKCEAEAKAGK